MSAATAASVWILSGGALACLTHDARDAAALAPPFDGVLHAGLRLALAIVLAVSVGLPAVGAGSKHGATDEILANLATENIGKSDGLAVLRFNCVILGEQASIHLLLLDGVDQIVGFRLHQITLPACSRY